jgi:hypothetical protein
LPLWGAGKTNNVILATDILPLWGVGKTNNVILATDILPLWGAAKQVYRSYYRYIAPLGRRQNK